MFFPGNEIKYPQTATLQAGPVTPRAEFRPA